MTTPRLTQEQAAHLDQDALAAEVRAQRAYDGSSVASLPRAAVLLNRATEATDASGALQRAKGGA